MRRDVLNRYDAALQELQVNFQKAADLEGAVAVRAAEREEGCRNGYNYLQQTADSARGG